MHQRTVARRRRKLAIERRMARGCEQVRHAHPRESLALLLHQEIERQREFGTGVRVDELDGAELAEPLQLGAIAAAGRRRALRRIERLPVGGKLRLIGAARIELHVERQHRIFLPADLGRHLVERDEVVARCGRFLQQPVHVVPQGEEAVGRELRELGREQRRVVVAENVAEKRQTAGEAAARNPQRQQQQQLIAAPRDDDGRGDALRGADMALPGEEPVEGLERRAVRGPFEAPPVGFDGREIVMDRKADRCGRDARDLRAQGNRIFARERGFLPPVPRSVT